MKEKKSVHVYVHQCPFLMLETHEVREMYWGTTEEMNGWKKLEICWGVREKMNGWKKSQQRRDITCKLSFQIFHSGIAMYQNVTFELQNKMEGVRWGDLST